MMDFRIKDKETLASLVTMVSDMHKECPNFQRLSFNPARVVQLLKLTQHEDGKFFLIYSKNQKEIQGMFLGFLTQPFFSDDILAHDFLMYVKPEYRGTPVFVKMLRSFEEWAKSKGAKAVRVGHTTGIDTEKAPPLFSRLGHSSMGYLFNKEF